MWHDSVNDDDDDDNDTDSDADDDADTDSDVDDADNDINNDADMTTACREKNKGTGALFFSLSLFSDAVLMSKIVVRDIYPLTYYNKNRSKRVYQAWTHCKEVAPIPN